MHRRCARVGGRQAACLLAHGANVLAEGSQGRRVVQHGKHVPLVRKLPLTPQVAVRGAGATRRSAPSSRPVALRQAIGAGRRHTRHDMHAWSSTTGSGA
jgi:hypothetical protein